MKRRPTPAFVVAVLALVVAIAILVLTDDSPEQQGSAPPPASTPGPPSATARSESASPSPSDEATTPAPGTYEVASVLADGTIELANGSEVVLVGVTVGDCAVTALGGLVNGRQVVLVQPGADTDSEGRLLRYVERDGLDVGLRLLQRGLATAADTPNPRRAIYQRVDDRNPDVCGS